MVDLSQAATIEHAKSGKRKPANFFILLKDIKMLYIPWLLTFLTGNYFLLFRDKVATGSFDKTAKLWDCETGNLLYTFAGHEN